LKAVLAEGDDLARNTSFGHRARNAWQNNASSILDRINPNFCKRLRIEYEAGFEHAVEYVRKKVLDMELDFEPSGSSDEEPHQTKTAAEDGPVVVANLNHPKSFKEFVEGHALWVLGVVIVGTLALTWQVTSWQFEQRLEERDSRIRQLERQLQSKEGNRVSEQSTPQEPPIVGVAPEIPSMEELRRSLTDASGFQESYKVTGESDLSFEEYLRTYASLFDKFAQRDEFVEDLVGKKVTWAGYVDDLYDTGERGVLLTIRLFENDEPVRMIAVTRYAGSFRQELFSFRGGDRVVIEGAFTDAEMGFPVLSGISVELDLKR